MLRTSKAAARLSQSNNQSVGLPLPATAWLSSFLCGHILEWPPQDVAAIVQSQQALASTQKAVSNKPRPAVTPMQTLDKNYIYKFADLDAPY